MLVRPSGAIGVSDIDIRLGEALTNPSQLARLIQNFQDNDTLFHDVKPLLFQKEERLRGVIDKKPHDRNVHGIVNCHGEDIDFRLGENGASAGKISRTVLQENGKLFLDSVHSGPQTGMRLMTF